jgi:acyl-CoA hydrolase
MPTLQETRVETRRFVFPGQSNASGTAHGGDLVKWMEQVGGMSAMRFAGTDVVTAGMDAVRFHRPIPQGSIALFEGYVYDAGTSSVRSQVLGYDENRHTADRTLATEARLVQVAVDGDGGTVTVPDLTVETDEGRRLREAATDDGPADRDPD